ncbi:MAG: hypothetical protein EP344_13705 [Bacteroidetes bacterium]|nr:MAG: hypothetical protein EP344_13705 [Bacteroidota bacterium]
MNSIPFIRSRLYTLPWLFKCLPLILGLCLTANLVQAQDEGGDEEEVVSNRPVRATFESAMLIDNQSVMVPIKGTFEFDIQHRFGTLHKGFEDLYGLYAPSNIRLGFLYVPIENLSVGFGLTKNKNLVDLNLKYAIFKQRQQGWQMPVSLTYFGNMVIDPRKEETRGEVYHESDRISYFHQVILARKINRWLSVQLAPSVTHFNLVEDVLNNDHFALAFGAQVKVTPTMAILLNVDQPLTKHTAGNPSPNPNPNISFGLQMSTSSHAFQIFLGNYNSLVPQENNLYYRLSPDAEYNNDWGSYWDTFTKRFRIGFNVTRLWNF